MDLDNEKHPEKNYISLYLLLHPSIKSKEKNGSILDDDHLDKVVYYRYLVKVI